MRRTGSALPEYMFSGTRVVDLPSLFQTQNSTPSFPLFRYFPPQRADVLETARVSFTAPTSFNDPFDIAPIFVPPPLHVTKHGIREELRNHQLEFCGSRKERREILRKMEKGALAR